MNYQNKLKQIKHLKSMIRPTCPEGVIKITSGESLEHATTKLQCGYYLKINDWDIWSECHILDRFGKVIGRVDLVGIHKSGQGAIIEVKGTESDSSLLEKADRYGEEFYFKIVDTKTFNYKEFCI